LTSPTGVSLDFICALKAQREGFRVVIDPSHGTKERSYVGKLAKASWAMGFDVMIEVHPRPTESVSDAAQAIGLDECEALFRSFQ
jgi:3-deoxy-D-arabino-heptulosonate 7-phosphate (DAHP) synthase